MQNDVFNPVADTVNKQSELLLKEQNCFTVIDESIPSPREIQSEDTIVLPEIVSMTDYIHRHYEDEIIAACMNQIYGLQLCVMYEGKLFHDVPGLGPIDYGEEELILFPQSVNEFLLEFVGYQVAACAIRSFAQGIAEATIAQEAVVGLPVHGVCQRRRVLRGNLPLTELFKSKLSIADGHVMVLILHDSVPPCSYIVPQYCLKAF